MSTPNSDDAEIAKFSRFSAHWWDPDGELQTLHVINPVRLGFIQQKSPLKDKAVIDIGCGGGLLSEAMAKIGANVTGIDLSEEALNVAKLHAKKSGLEIEYLLTPAEKIAKERPAEFDVVTCLEMLEHVPDPAAIIQAAAALLKPGGQLFVSTLNRTMKSYLFAIIGAEYVAKILPKGTHDYAKFIRPSEIDEWARKAGLRVTDIIGLKYHVLTKQATLDQDISVNYIMRLVK